MARKFLDKDGLTALWAKIVDKINSIGDNFVKKTGDIITGSLYIKGYDLVLDTTSSSSNDSADIRWQYGNAKEKARVWTADNPTTAADGRLNFRVYKEDGTSLYSGKLATAGDIDSRVAKTGDTMSGNLYVAHAEPVFVSKITSVDASKSNNNVSSTRYPGFTVLDNSSRILTRNEAVISSDGNIKNYLYVRNYNTSGAQVAQKGIGFTMNKSGALTWAVDDAANFRTAIGIGGLGSYTTATGTYTTAVWAAGDNTCIWKAPAAGTYIVYMRYSLSTENATNKSMYKQFQMRGTATRVLDQMLYFDAQASAGTCTRTISQPVVATAANQTIIPYIHTDVAKVPFSVKIVGLRII